MSNAKKPKTTFDLHSGQVAIDGVFVNQKVSDVVEAMREYDPRIEVEWIPPAKRLEIAALEGDSIAAFRVLYHPDEGESYTIFHVQDEADFDERQLARIMANDAAKAGYHVTDLEAYEAALMRVKHQEYLDKLEEAQDIAAHVLATRKNKYKVNNDLVIDDTKPFNVAHLDERTGLPKKGSPGYDS